jgi:hypothetical protein
MPIEVGIWKIGHKLERINFSTIESESKLEDNICADLSLLAPQLMKLGRQVLRLGARLSTYLGWILTAI